MGGRKRGEAVEERGKGVGWWWVGGRKRGKVVEERGKRGRSW